MRKYIFAAVAGLFIFISAFAQTEKREGIFIVTADSFACVPLCHTAQQA